MRTYPASEARACLPKILDFVADGEEITITRHGRPVAIVVHPNALRRRRRTEAIREAEELHERIEEARRNPRPFRPVLTLERAEELVAEIRADRDAR